MKIAILVNESTMERCTGKGCFKAFLNKLDGFSGYDEEAELVAFTHCGGNLDRKIQKLLNEGVEVVHLSSCMRASGDEYKRVAKELGQHFKVVGYSHGSSTSERGETIYIDQVKKEK